MLDTQILHKVNFQKFRGKFDFIKKKINRFSWLEAIWKENNYPWTIPKKEKMTKKTQETIYCFPSYLKIFQPKRFQIHFRSIFFNFIFSLWKIDFLDLMDLTTVPALWTITLTSLKPICNTSCMKWMTTWSYRSITSCCEWIHACWTSNRHLFEIVNLPNPLLICTWILKNQVRRTGFLGYKNQFRNWFL